MTWSSVTSPPPDPIQLWVADLTYVRAWQGFSYLAFILDVYSRMIVGWQLATHMRAELVVDALGDGVGLRRPHRRRLTAHTDRGSQPEHRERNLGRLPKADK